jgi:hypothetical protein
MTLSLVASAGLAILIAVNFALAHRLPEFRRKRAARRGWAIAIAATAALAYGMAQVAREWPFRHYWGAALAEDVMGKPFCVLATTDNPDRPDAAHLIVALSHGATRKMFAIAWTGQGHEIPAPKISFSSDGFLIASFPATSKFAREGDGRMANTAVAILADADWDRLLQVFRSSGKVIASTSFVDATLPTLGFDEAWQDFERCLEQVRLVNGNRLPPPLDQEENPE